MLSAACSSQPDEVQFIVSIQTPTAGGSAASAGAETTGIGGAAPDTMGEPNNRWTMRAPTIKAPADTRPNIVVILSDDLGYAEVGFHGAEDFPTPHLVDLAEQGVTFTQAYAASSVCSPSRAGLLTGRYQQRFGFEMNIQPVKKAGEDQGLPLSERTLADHLTEVGYQTVAIGKWHLGFAEHFTPLSRGFDHFYGFLGGSRSYFPEAKPQPGHGLMLDNDLIEEDFDYLTDDLARAAVEYIQMASDAPFFMYLAPTAVHGPLEATADRLAHYPHLTGQRQLRAAMVEALDDLVGEVVGALEARGVRDNTLIVFTDDNGGNVVETGADNTPLNGGKGSSYEGGNRVPMIVSYPGRFPKGGHFAEPVSALDIVATSLSLARVVPVEDNLDGLDLTPYLEDEVSYPMRSFFLRRGQNWSVRFGDLKLRGRGEGAELYNLDVDPGESTDLASTSPVAVELLGDLYAGWTRELPDPLW